MLVNMMNKLFFPQLEKKSFLFLCACKCEPVRN